MTYPGVTIIPQPPAGAQAQATPRILLHEMRVILLVTQIF
jgi:hypothetical protein